MYLFVLEYCMLDAHLIIQFVSQQITNFSSGGSINFILILLILTEAELKSKTLMVTLGS